ncbi:MAG TPA: glycogen debranching protein GlgX [Geminicoccaceae bacterium]|nr:glycogen debranching protein GlgX [Geminicoccaceae bacterium]
MPGLPWPLGATVGGEGVNIAVASAHATRIELCLFDGAGRETRRDLPARTGDIWHGYFPDLRPGQAYGLRAHGPFAPERGHWFDPSKLLLDPYAKQLTGRFAWTEANRGGRESLGHDTAAFMPKAVITDPAEFTPLPPGPVIPWTETIVYEAHVKGLTKRHPALPEAWRGTYLGLARPEVLDHLIKLGITAVELLPVWAFLDERRLVAMGLRNYWGYNPVAMLAPEPRYAVADPVAELRAAIAALHGAGIEVVLDVVLNHTAESDADGPTLSWRGLDNTAYYRLGEEGFLVNHTGCGNTFDLSKPWALRLAMDALRHWATAYGVDGFRFDLGAVLGRDSRDHFDADGPFLQAIRQDPLLSRLKLIAEPWDIGAYGYRLGGFPQPFAEWNDRFRDPVRRFWRGDEGIVPELAARLLGSADLFEHGRRAPWSSLNFVASHDGFTLADLGTYAHKHNEANGEHNRDGHGDNHGLNHGIEGPTDDPAVLEARARHRKALLATLLLSQGTPMLLMGDELGHSQRGNNNAYCQDSPISWLDWDKIDESLLAFVRRLVALRRDHSGLRRDRFLHGADACWLDERGHPMTARQWREPSRRFVALRLDGDQPLLLLLNAGDEPVAFPVDAMAWELLLATAESAGHVEPRSVQLWMAFSASLS